MKKILFLLIILCILANSFTMANDKTFIDVENHWARENIYKLVKSSIIDGYPDKTFRPNTEVTTLEFIKILLKTLDIKLVKEGLNEWPEHYIATAKKYNLSENYYEKLTRYEAVDIISKLIDLKGISTSSNKFKDLNGKYKNNILKLSKLNVISGYEDNTFRGDKTLTRAEAITIAIRCAEARKQIINKTTYEINEEYTNVGFAVEDKGEIDKIRYEIKNNKLVFRDEGRFSYLTDYSIDEKYITNRKLISIIKELVSENSYTAVYYVPSKYIINQIIIKFGEDDNYINRGLDYFSFTYYEDKLYDLNRISLKDTFTNECYMKISVKKLWNDLCDFENGKYVDEYIKVRFLNALKIEFGKDAEEILNYILDKYNKDMNKEFEGEVVVEKIQINDYIINFYKTDATSLEFYFEKLSS